MAKDLNEGGPENTAEEQSSRIDLEARLNVTPTPKTDLMEFLAIAGISYDHWEPFRFGADKTPNYGQMLSELQQARLNRARSLPLGERMVESHLTKAIWDEYLSGNSVKTIGDLERVVQRSFAVPHLSFRGIARLNASLSEFGMEPMSVGYGSKNELAKHGLVKYAAKSDASEDQKIGADLEARLNVKPNLDTDLIEFLAIAGISYRYWEPFRQGRYGDPPGARAYLEQEQKRLDRTSSLSRADRWVEAYIAKAFWVLYHTTNEAKTIRDLGNELQRGKVPHLSFNGIARLNNYFEEFGIEPMAVGYGSSTELAKYGLVRANVTSK